MRAWREDCNNRGRRRSTFELNSERESGIMHPRVRHHAQQASLISDRAQPCASVTHLADRLGGGGLRRRLLVGPECHRSDCTGGRVEDRSLGKSTWGARVTTLGHTTTCTCALSSVRYPRAGEVRTRRTCSGPHSFSRKCSATPSRPHTREKECNQRCHPRIL